MRLEHHSKTPLEANRLDLNIKLSFEAICESIFKLKKTLDERSWLPKVAQKALSSAIF